MGDEQSAPLRAPAGTHDVLWPESARWERLVAEFARRARLAGFGLVVSPMFEDAALFRRGIGDESDVVRKEMYEFERPGRARRGAAPRGHGVGGAGLRPAPPAGPVEGAGTSRPPSATSGPRPGATSSTTSSAWRCSAPTTPTSTSR